jgi:hypothetical protein
MYVLVWLRFQYLDYAKYEYRSLAPTLVTLIVMRDFFLYFLFFVYLFFLDS